MSKNGIIATLMAQQLCDAVVKDEDGEGIDISAGLFGTATSDLMREWAGMIVGDGIKVVPVRETPEAIARKYTSTFNWSNPTLEEKIVKGIAELIKTERK